MSREQLRQIAIDADLFEVFYRENVEEVQRFVARRTADRESAADLTVDVFLAAIDAAPRYKPQLGPPRAWLFGIARIVVANDGRRSERRREGEARVRGSALLGEEDATRLDRRIDAERRSRDLYAAMDRLPEGERAVLELVAIDELSIGEAAASTGLRPVTARVRLHRARRKLREELEAASDRSNPTKEYRDEK